MMDLKMCTVKDVIELGIRIYSGRSTWGLASCVAKLIQACLSPCASLRVLNRYGYSKDMDIIYHIVIR